MEVETLVYSRKRCSGCKYPENRFHLIGDSIFQEFYFVDGKPHFWKPSGFLCF